VRGLGAARQYAIGLRSGKGVYYAGHNPLGGWMIVALLLDLLVQAGTGLFANDDIMMEGPLFEHVSKETSDLLTRIHEANFWVLFTLVALHVAAALYYLWVKRDNLIGAMFTGSKQVPQGETAEDLRGGPLWLAVVLLAACAAAVWLAVRQ
jgi:cytochrome b